MEIDPLRETFEITTPAIGADPNVTSFERLTLSRFAHKEGLWFRLCVDAREMHYEAYMFLQCVVDQIHSGATFRRAVSEALRALNDLLASRRKLTRDEELGLIGELLVLRHVVQAVGENAAIGSWLGPLSEEHDFAFAKLDAEIKTTTSETRAHLIGSETQLEPSPERPLYLVSIQLTRAGNASRWFSLASLISEIRPLLDAHQHEFDLALAGLGWRGADSDLYQSRYQFRTMPRSYVVDDHFPAITLNRLAKAVPQRARIDSVTYRLNVTDLAYSKIGSPLEHFCEAPV